MSNSSTARLPQSENDKSFVRPSSSTGNDVFPFSVKESGIFQVHFYNRSSDSVTQVTSGDDDSFVEDISKNGRYILIRTFAQNLVGPMNPVPQLILRDTTNPSGQFQLLSEEGGNEGDKPSINGSINSDASFAVWQSKSTNFDGTTNGFFQIFRKNLSSGTLNMISRGESGTKGDNHSSNPIFEESNKIVFDSKSSNFINQNTGNTRQIYRKNTSNGNVDLVSKSGKRGSSWSPEILQNGIAFLTNDSEIVGTVDKKAEIPTQVAKKEGSFSLLSKDEQGRISFKECKQVSGAENSNEVVFSTKAKNLLGESVSNEQIVGFRPNNSQALLLSVGINDGHGNGKSFHPVITNDGVNSLFESMADNLISSDTNNNIDIFLRENWQNLDLPPVSNAGSDIRIDQLNNWISLDGSNSYDPEGGKISYSWSILSKPSSSQAKIINSSNKKALILPDEDSEYEIQLTVTDEDGNSSSDTMSIFTPEFGAVSSSSTSSVNAAAGVRVRSTKGSFGFFASANLEENPLEEVQSDLQSSVSLSGASEVV